MVKILGILDILAAIILLSVSFNAGIPKGLVMVISSLLCLKGVIFIFNIISVFDIGIGILLLLSLFMILPPLLLFIAAGFLGVKGILSLAP